MKVISAIYINNSSLVNRLISTYTWLPNIGTPAASHAELGMEKEDKFTYFSSTNRDNCHGTRWAFPEKVIKHPNNWLLYEKNYHSDEVLRMIERADSIIPADYDWWGIGGFATITGLLNSKSKWYCSEACYYVLTGIWRRRISPRKYVKVIKKLGFTEING